MAGPGQTCQLYTGPLPLRTLILRTKGLLFVELEILLTGGEGVGEMRTILGNAGSSTDLNLFVALPLGFTTLGTLL